MKVFLPNLYFLMSGIFYAAAVVVFAAVMCLVLKENKVNIKRALCAAVPVVIIGADVSHVVFFLSVSPDKNDFSRLFSLSSGGFSMFGLLLGAALGAMLGGLLFSVKPLVLLDSLAVSLPAALSVGMFSCFFSEEYIGKECKTGLFPFGVLSRTEGVYRRPLFFYMSVYCAVLCFVFGYLFIKKSRSGSTAVPCGLLFVLFLVFYSSPAGIMEAFRGDHMILNPLILNKLHIFQISQSMFGFACGAGLLIIMLVRYVNRLSLDFLWTVPTALTMYLGYFYDQLHIASVYDTLNIAWRCVSAAGLCALTAYHFIRLVIERKNADGEKE